MFPYLLVTIPEFKKIFLCKYSIKRYLFVFLWYLFICTFIFVLYEYVKYYHISYDKNVFVFNVNNIMIMFSLFCYSIINILNFIFLKIPDELDESYVNNIEWNFRERTAIVIACHNSEDVIGKTLEKAIIHYLPENIYVADNNKTQEPPNTKTKDITESLKCNYVYIPRPNKTGALRVVVNKIYKDYEYLILLDDDTLFPDRFNLSEREFLNNKKVCGVGFGIRGGSLENLVEECVDYEYKVWCYKSYMKSFASSDFIIGIAGIWKSKIFREIININPAGNSLPFGEDGFNGMIARRNGYVIQQDFQNMFKTYTPNKLFYNYKELMCMSSNISGYNSTNIWKQRVLRWYRSGTIRILNEFLVAVIFDASNPENTYIKRFIQNIFFRLNYLWRILILYWSIMIPMTIYFYRNDLMTLIFIKIFLYVFGVIAHVINFFRFYFRTDLQFNFYICLIYPVFSSFMAIMKLFGFLSSLTFYIPFHLDLSLYQNKFELKETEEDEPEEPEEFFTPLSLSRDIELVIIK